jgi:hypothetical protein
VPVLGIVALLTVAVAGCSGGKPAGPQPASTAEALGSPPQSGKLQAIVELRFDQTVVHRDLAIRLLEIEDSRCPTGVACVWEGQVTVRLEVAEADGDAAEEPVQVELTLRAAHESPGETARGRVLRLLGVDPYPKEGVPAARGAWRVRVEIKVV